MYPNILYNKYVSTGYGRLNSKIDQDRSILSIDHNYGFILPTNLDGYCLEIGCGMGHFQNYLNKKGYQNRIAIDIGPEQITYCEKHVDGTFILVENTNDFLSNHPESFDFIVMNDVLEHFTKNEVVEILVAIKKSLKDSGKLIMRTPNMSSLFAGASRYGDFTHEVGFTERSIRQLLHALDFEQVECFPEKHYIHSPIKRVLFSVISLARTTLLKALVFSERPGDNYPTIFSKNLIISASLSSQ